MTTPWRLDICAVIDRALEFGHFVSKPRSGETILATGVSPWFLISIRTSPVGAAQCLELCRPYGAVSFNLTAFHGLAPVARIVSPLRGFETKYLNSKARSMTAR